MADRRLGSGREWDRLVGNRRRTVPDECSPDTKHSWLVSIIRLVAATASIPRPYAGTSSSNDSSLTLFQLSMFY